MSRHPGTELLVASACIAVMAACDDPNSRFCEPGAVEACSCDDGSIEMQRCNDDGMAFEPCPCPETDGGVDGDGDADEDIDSGQDADADEDVEVWAPLAGCTGEVTEERWLVASVVEDQLRAFVTGRDCEDPVELCVDCFPASLSPSGHAVLAVVPTAMEWRLDDEIVLISLEGTGPVTSRIGLYGALPVWAGDDTFYYVAAGPGAVPCEESGGRPEPTQLRRYSIATGEDVAVGPTLARARHGGFPAPAPSQPLIAEGHDYSRRCSRVSLAVSILDLPSGDMATIPWTELDDVHGLAGTLPDGSGFLVQSPQVLAGPSNIYAVSWDGEALRVAEHLDAAFDWWLIDGHARGMWHSCATARRIGPACELYCRTIDGSMVFRHSLVTEESVAVACPALGVPFRIMDVWQR